MPFSFSRLSKACLVSVFAFQATSVLADNNPAGAYLAARLASSQSDYANAAEYYDRLLLDQPTERIYQEGALISHVALGQYDQAAGIATVMMADNPESTYASLVSLAAAAQKADFNKGIALLDQGANPGNLIAGIYRGWALAGLGRASEATKVFDDMARSQDTAMIAMFHKALALAMVGDYEGADAILSGKYANVLHSTRRGILAHIEVLSQLERNEDALKILDEAFGQTPDPDIAALRAKLVAGDRLPFTVVPNATAGIAEIYLTAAQALSSGDAPSTLALVHARLASWMRPDLGDAALVAGATLEAQKQYDLASATFENVPLDNPVYPAARMGQAEVLRASGQPDAAIAVLEGLTKEQPDLFAAWVTLGDHLRGASRFREAADAYDKAAALSGPPVARNWFVYFARGISRDRSGDWPGAEQDLKLALELSPSQSAVLNYLGYSYVEKKQNLDQALDLIQRAVAASPQEGYIVDSLGWAYFRLGQYDKAVEPMEKAVQMEPREALLNDHLGDVYWAVGRKREAEYQWRRALNFGPAEDLDMDRVRRKLDVGLDQVLQDEGAAPLHAVQNAN